LRSQSHGGAQRIDGGAAEGFQLCPLLENNFYAVIAERLESLVPQTAELEAAAPQVGAGLIGLQVE
jgi:hypothetical protein